MGVGERQRGVRLLSKLSSRWQSVTDKLVESQPWEVARATKGRHVGLIGLLAMVVDWPDLTFMRDMVFGFPALGFSPNVPAFAAQEATWMILEDVWNGAEEDAVRIVRRLGPSEFDEAIVEAGEKDEKLQASVERTCLGRSSCLAITGSGWSEDFASNSQGASWGSSMMQRMVGSRPWAWMPTSLICARRSSLDCTSVCCGTLSEPSTRTGSWTTASRPEGRTSRTPIAMFQWDRRNHGPA